MKKNPIKELSFELALMGIRIFREFNKQKEFILSKQFLKSTTSIGANVAEALDAESKRDFIHKMSISLKEARETEYWIKLFQESLRVSWRVPWYTWRSTRRSAGRSSLAESQAVCGTPGGRDCGTPGTPLAGSHFPRQTHYVKV